MIKKSTNDNEEPSIVSLIVVLFFHFQKNVGQQAYVFSSWPLNILWKIKENLLNFTLGLRFLIVHILQIIKHLNKINTVYEWK